MMNNLFADNSNNHEDKVKFNERNALQAGLRKDARQFARDSVHRPLRAGDEMSQETKSIYSSVYMYCIEKSAEELLAEKAAADPLAKEILDSQAEYMAKARVWTNISDRAYLDSLDNLAD